jgi:outer membrane protein OmpA-like peptidoglycan-associated protein
MLYKKTIKTCWLILLAVTVSSPAKAQQIHKDSLPVTSSNSKNCPCNYPVIYFKLYSTVLSKKTLKLLDLLGRQLKANPGCTISIITYAYSSEREYDICQRRGDAMRTYLVERKKINLNRIYLDCIENGGDRNTAEIKCN